MTWVNEFNSALLTDLYELTMAASYQRHGMTGRATFDLFVRDLPEKRNFLVAAGLEQALEYLQNLHFDEESISLSRLPQDVRRGLPYATWRRCDSRETSGRSRRVRSSSPTSPSFE